MTRRPVEGSNALRRAKEKLNLRFSLGVLLFLAVLLGLLFMDGMIAHVSQAIYTRAYFGPTFCDKPASSLIDSHSLSGCAEFLKNGMDASDHRLPSISEY